MYDEAEGFEQAATVKAHLASHSSTVVSSEVLQDDKMLRERLNGAQTGWMGLRRS